MNEPNESKNILQLLGDWWQARPTHPRSDKKRSEWLPTPGNIIFTLLVAFALVLTQQAWANNGLNSVTTSGPSATTVNYQGRLADSNGNPISGNRTIQFAIYDAASGGNIVWDVETHANVPVTDGLFNVGLGSLTSGGIPTTVWNGDRYLQITVNGEPLSPRELIRSVPIAGMAMTVPDGAITTRKLAPDAFPKITSHIHDSEILALGTGFQKFSSTNAQIVVTQRSHILITAKGNAITSGTGGYYAGICRNDLSGSGIGETHQHTPNIANAPPFEKFAWAWIDSVEAGTYTYSICAGNPSGTNVTLRWYRPTISLVAFPAP